MNILFIIIGVLSIVYIINRVRKGSFSINESIFWVIGGVCILVLSIFPQIIIWLASKVGVEYPPSLLFMLCSIFLIFINFRNSRKIAEQQEKIIELAQHIAIIENEIEGIKNEK